MFAVVFVAMHNATHRLPYGDASISCYNVIFLFPVLAHFTWELLRERSSRSSEVRFCILIPLLVLLCVHSTHLCLDHSYGFTVKVQTWLWCWPKWIWAKLNNTVHFTYGQLVVLHCAADYQSGKRFCKLISNGHTDWLFISVVSWCAHTLLHPVAQLNSTVSVH